MLYGIGPMISAIIVTVIYRGKSGIKELFNKVITWKVSLRWYLTALILPVIPQWTGLFLWAQLTGTTLALPTVAGHLSSWLQITLVATAYYVTEEVGWRGFMLSRVLSMRTWLKASLLVGVIWTIWHYPLWILSTWATTGSLMEMSLMVTANSVIVIGISVMLTWIFKNTKGSILLAMLLHGANQVNLTKMYTAAGDASLHGPGFIIVQAVTFSITVVLLLLIIRNNNK
jgi:membrane protease YdiL (CAAX protease family)